MNAAPAVANRPPTGADVRALVQAQRPPVAAVFVPLPAAVPEASSNALRLRHVADALERRMEALALSAEQRAALRAPLAEFFAGAAPPPPGISARGAVVTDDRALSFGLPYEADERAYVGRCVPARALLRAAEQGGSYRVVAVSANRVRVAVGDARGLTGEAVPELPASLVDALGPELEKAGLQFHNVSGSGSQPVYHGHKDASAERELDRERFHRVLEDALARVFAGSRVPIVWVADRSHHPVLRALAPRVPFVGAVDGSADHWSDRELHERAWPLVVASVRREREAARGGLDRARSRGEAVLGRQAVVEAVIDGRARCLWVPADARAPGHVDETRRAAAAPWGDEDLFDDLACLALRRGADVRVADGDALGPEAEIAAQLR